MHVRTIAVGAAALAVLLSGCARPYVKQYHQAVSVNREHIGKVQVGMSRSDVESVMGAGPLVDYGKIQLRNPWRSEVYEKNGHRFDVVYYVTNGQTWSKSQSDEQNLTPVLFEDDKVIGWGWAFIDRTPRYVSGPFVMPKQAD